MMKDSTASLPDFLFDIVVSFFLFPSLYTDSLSSARLELYSASAAVASTLFFTFISFSRHSPFSFFQPASAAHVLYGMRYA